jgi:hypothetical protein
MTFRFGAGLGDLDDITPADIVAFLREVMGRKTPYRDRTPPTHLRSLFRFRFWSGKTKRDLASSLPVRAKKFFRDHGSMRNTDSKIRSFGFNCFPLLAIWLVVGDFCNTIGTLRPRWRCSDTAAIRA